LVIADPFDQERFKRLEEGRSAADFRAQGTALDLQQFGRLGLFFDDEPFLLP